MTDDEPGLATLLTLSHHMCRWPIGDPREALTFCGLQRRDDKSAYCAGHAARAYSRPATNRTVADLARSVRRYV